MSSWCKDPPREALERVCRLYRTNKDAMKAAGIGLNRFKKLVKIWKIETPGERKKRQWTPNKDCVKE